MPVTIGSTTIGAAALTGNPAAGQRGKFLQLPRFRVRVLDPVSGAVIIDRLPHITLEYETIFSQAGMAGASAVGHFTIHLYHPLTDEYAWAKVWYDRLDQMQRIEIYMTEDPDGYGVVGDPVFTGIIEDLPKEDSSYRIEGEDSLKLLDWSRTLGSDTFTGLTSDLAKYALKTYQMTNVGDFNADGSWKLSAYTNDGGWTTTTDQGFASIKKGTSGDGLLFSSSYANSKYADCFVEAPFRLVSAPGGSSAAAGVIAAVTDSNNLVLGQAALRYVAAGQYYVDAAIWQKSGGSYTLKAQTQNVIAETTNAAQVTVTLVGVQTSATTYTWRVLLNEIDSNCVWVQNQFAGSPIGGVGVRGSVGEAIYVQHHLLFMSKSNAFQQGNIATGSQRVNQPISSQANLNLLQLAASTEGGVWSKRPKAGLNQDLIDFAVSTGGDLSGIVRFEQDLTIVASQSERNAEQLNTAVLAAGHPAYNNRGKHRWIDVTAIARRGYVIAPAVLPEASDTFALRQMAQNVLLHRTQPTQAKRMTVARHESHAELPGQPKPTGLAYAPGDWVVQHEPRKGINYQRVQIMSAKVVAGVPTMELTLDQYPVSTDRLPLLDRLHATVVAAQLQRSSDSQKDPALGVSYDKRLVLPINLWKMRATLSGNQNITDGAVAQLITFDTVSGSNAVWDTANGFDTSAHQYTIKVAGWYAFSATVQLSVNSANHEIIQVGNIALYQNGAQARNLKSLLLSYEDVGGSNVYYGGPFTWLLSDHQYFNAGDVLDVRFSYDNGAATTETIVAASSWFSLHLISG